MRILQISSASSFGGGERYAVDLSNSLTTRGHELFAAVRPQSPLINYLQIPGANIKTLPLRNAFDAPSAQALARVVKENQIDVVHAHMARDYSLAAYATRNNPTAKFFVTRHVLFSLNRLHRHTLGKAAKVIAVSNAVAQQLRSQQLVPEEKIAVVPNGIDVDRYRRALQNFDRKCFLESKQLPADSLLVGSIGELRILKRHDDFIRVAALVAQEVPNTHFVIAGVDTSPNEEYRRQLQGLVAEVGLSDRVHFLGWLDDADHLLCALDAFVSTSETESFGLSIAEAMATGTPVVATRTEGAQEVVEDEATGLLVPIGDVDQIAAALIRLLKDRELRMQLGARAAKVVQERFSLDRMVDEIERLYQG